MNPEQQKGNRKLSVAEMFMKKPYIWAGQTLQQLGSRPSQSYLLIAEYAALAEAFCFSDVLSMPKVVL